MTKTKRTVKFAALAATAAVCLVATSCASNKLYSWYSYEKDYADYVKKTDPESLAKLIKTYDKIIEKQKGARGVVPPGIYADYGYFLIQDGKVKQGKEMLAKEVELYPESAVLVKSILKRVE